MGEILYKILCNVLGVAWGCFITYLCASSIHQYVQKGRRNRDGWVNLFWAIISGAYLLHLMLT